MTTSARLSGDALLEALKSWVRDNPEQVVTLVSDDFDVAGQQEVIRVRPKAIERAEIDGATGKGTVRAKLDVIYKNPAFDDDEDLSAVNVTDYTASLGVSIDLTSGEIEELDHAAVPE